MEASNVARRIVNHAPSGTLVSAEDKKVPSSDAKSSAGRRMKYGLIRHTRIATRVTMHVSKKVTNMTHTPYALPRDVVLL